MTDRGGPPENCTAGFERTFGDSPEVLAHAPGRVNLIGEHTDYNGGFVLPTAIPQKTWVAMARRSDSRARVGSASFPEGGSREYSLGQEQAGQGWLDYVQGATAALRASGRSVTGFDAWICSEVPPGSGLSSSAALEVALLRALNELFGLAIEGVPLALLAQRGENDFVGAPVGVMDPIACSLGTPGVALFLDTRTLHYERVPIPPDMELGVIDSGVRHGHAGGEYRTRRAECEEAARRLGIAQLRDLHPGRAEDWRNLPEPLCRRVRHVVTENDRVLRAVEALRSGNLRELGELLFASHRSLREDFEVSTSELDLLVELVSGRPGVFGARLTGGGFGGSIVFAAARGAAEAAAREAALSYGERSERDPRVLLP